MSKSGKKQSKDHVLITRDENNALRIKNDNLIQRVKNSAVFIEDAEVAVKERDKQIRDIIEWKAYLACDHIPKPFEPEEVRKFFNKTLYFEEEDIEHTVNWLLAVDERSILNQDIDSVNLTKRFIKESRENFGKKYDTRVNEAMEISRRVQDFLENPTRVLSVRMLRDVAEMKFFAYEHINQYIDNLTYRILCSEDAYMDSIDVTTAEYSYQAQNFDIHLWTFKNVPIYLNPSETPTKTIKLTQIKTTVVMPFSVLCENMVIRGLHCKFDHFSAYARYFELPQSGEVEQSLTKCLQDEWDTQMKIQDRVRAMMINQRAEYDEAVRLKAEEEELNKRQRKKEEDKPDKAAKVKKLPREPPIVTPDLVPLVRNDFLNEDFQEYQGALMDLHPNKFGLTIGEINLRKYQILGGVYQINSLSKPKVVNIPKLIISWYKADQRVEYKNIQSEFNTTQSPDIAKFFKMTFVLPECFCHWGEPIPCLFEEGESYRAANLEDSSESAENLKIGSPIIINDFNLHELFTKRLMYEFIENSIPRLISSFKFPEDLFDEEEDKKAKATLGRAKLTAAEQEKEKELMMQRQLLSVDVQQCPERLFPLFKKVLPVVILPIEEENQKTRLHPYEHFSEFMSSVQFIEDSYRMSKFKDNLGKPLTIVAEKYPKNIRRPWITRKSVLYDSADKRGSTKLARTSKISVGSKTSVIEESSLTGHSKTSLIESTKHEGDTAKQGKTKASKASKARNKDIPKDEVIEVDEDHETNFSKWSTANILKSEFSAQDRKVTIWTDRLGIFGFAYYRYQHFPFQSWSLQPNEENPEEVELTIESVFAVFRIYVTQNGFKVSVTDFTKYYKSRKVYFEIKEPVRNIKVVKEKLQQMYLNIFPELDAAWYMSGYFSEKHLATEIHTYSCISLYATSLKFQCSIWNKLSDRRTIVLKFGELRDLEEDLFLLRIRPEEVMFVEIKEVCTDLETIELAYTPTWRNLEWYPDLNHVITSTYVNWSDMRTNDPNIIHYLKQLLQAIRPLSCS